MKILVDKLPIYEIDCLFYNTEDMTCKFDGRPRDTCGDPGSCPYLKVASLSATNLCCNYDPLERRD